MISIADLNYKNLFCTNQISLQNRTDFLKRTLRLMLYYIIIQSYDIESMYTSLMPIIST